jgi:hypothetical protein
MPLKPGEIVFTMKAKESYNPLRYVSNPVKYVLPYFTRKGEGPLGSPAGFEVLANFRTGLDNSTRKVSSWTQSKDKTRVDFQTFS